MPKQTLKEQIGKALVENMLSWKSTTKVSTKEFNKLLKEILSLLKEEKKKWAGEVEEIRAESHNGRDVYQLLINLLKKLKE